MAYTCPFCGMTSHNPNDETYRYCGKCRVFEDDQKRWQQLEKSRQAYADLMLHSDALGLDDD